MAPLTLAQAAVQQALAEGFAGGPIPTLNNANVNTQANIGNPLIPVVEPTPYYPPATTVTPNLGLSLQDLSVVDANNMVIIDTAIGSGSTGGVLRTSVTLTSAQILALNTTAVQLIPSPGVGNFVNIISVTAEYQYKTTPYTVGGAQLNISTLLGIPQGDLLFVSSANGVLTASSSSLDVFENSISSNPMSEFTNQAVVIKSTAPITSGDGTLQLVLIYTVEKA